MISNNIHSEDKTLTAILLTAYAENYSTSPTFIHIMSAVLSSESERRLHRPWA